MSLPEDARGRRAKADTIQARRLWWWPSTQPSTAQCFSSRYKKKIRKFGCVPRGHQRKVNNGTVQWQTTVTAHLKSKQLLLFA